MLLTWISLGISIFAVVFSLFTYFNHDKKLKEQKKALNNHRLKMIRKEKEKGKKADLSARYVKKEKVIRIENHGKASAYNIRFEIISDPRGLNYKEDIFPYSQIFAHDAIDIELKLIIEKVRFDRYEVELTWDDEYKKNNKSIYEIQLF